jgi:GT2 family glycosyltransferase
MLSGTMGERTETEISEIGVIIVTWNGKKHLERLLPSIFAQKFTSPMTVVVIDNGSADGTVAWLSSSYPKVHIIALVENHGFAGPNNIGFSYLLNNPHIDYIACINNDTVLPEDFFWRLISFAENTGENAGRVGALQTKIVSLDEPSVIDSVGITIDPGISAINAGQGETDAGQFETPRPIFGATASAALYTREALDAVFSAHGMCFDEDFFAYQEDVDLAFRMRLLGFTAWYVPGPPVLHVHSATGRSYSPFKSYHIHRNSLYMILKNMPGLLLMAGFIHFMTKYVGLLGSLLKKRGPSFELSRTAGTSGMARIVLKSWAVFMLHLPSLLVKRRRIQKSRVCGTRQVKRWFTEFGANREKMIYGTSGKDIDPV